MGSLTDLALGSRVVLRPYGVAAAVANLLYYQVLPSPDFKIVRALWCSSTGTEVSRSAFFRFLTGLPCTLGDNTYALMKDEADEVVRGGCLRCVRFLCVHSSAWRTTIASLSLSLSSAQALAACTPPQRDMLFPMH